MTTNDDTPKRPRGRPPKPRPENPEPKRPRGRPALGEAARTHNVTIRFSPADYQMLKRLAQEEGVTMVDYIMTPLRQALNKKEGEA